MIRIWLPVPVMYSPKHPWDDLALEYLQAFEACAGPVRAVAWSQGDFDSKESPWGKDHVTVLFTTPMGDFDTNIVVGGPNDIFDKLWTEGMRNIAVTGPIPREHTERELRMLDRWEVWWTHVVPPGDVSRKWKGE